MVVWMSSFLVFAPFCRSNPSGEQVVGGSASFDRSASTLQITTSDRAIINWQDFSIQFGETTKFLQPNSSSATLNRVITGNPSSLLGSLQANGQIFLINPNGILVGPSAQINTANFIASTLDIKNDEFMLGGDLHFIGPSQAGIQNQGSINAIGGNVFMMAHKIENTGVISAPDGVVGLGAGAEFFLKQGGNDLTMVQLAPEAAQPGVDTGILNQGRIEATQVQLKANGNIYQFAINNEGVVRATGAVEKDGRVILTSVGGKIKNSGSLLAQNHNGSGGKVIVQAKADGVTPSTVIHSGNIDVSGLAGGAKGGEVQLLADGVRPAQVLGLVVLL